MPFVSQAQWRQCFAAARRGKRNVKECKEFARMSKAYKDLPERVAKKKKQVKRTNPNRRYRKTVRQNVILRTFTFRVGPMEEMESSLEQGVYARNEDGRWALYLPVNGEYEEEYEVEDERQILWLDNKSMDVETPHVEVAMDIHGAPDEYIQFSPGRRKTARRILKGRHRR